VVRNLADELCGGRLALVLEGGYALSGLREGTGAVLDVLLAEEAPPLPARVESPAGSLLGHVVGNVAAVHRGRFRDLGAA